MLIIPPSKYPRKHGRVIDPAVPPLPASLTLVAATYQAGVSVTLTFDRPIDIAAYDGSEVFVYDAEETHKVWCADGAPTLMSAATVRVALSDRGSLSGAEIALVAPATTGLVAVTGGATWEGTEGLLLPFP